MITRSKRDCSSIGLRVLRYICSLAKRAKRKEVFTSSHGFVLEVLAMRYGMFRSFSYLYIY